MKAIRTCWPLILLTIATFAGAIFTGCTTTQTITTDPFGVTTTNTVTHLDPVKTSNAIKTIIPPAVTFAISQDPKVKPYLLKAQVAICLAAHAGKTSPAEIRAAVEATGIREIQTPEMQAAMETVFGIYNAYWSDVVAAKLGDVNPWLMPVLNAICEGLTTSLVTPVSNWQYQLPTAMTMM